MSLAMSDINKAHRILYKEMRGDMINNISSVKEASKIYWKEKNKICMGCEKKCKQSSKATLVKCPEYVKNDPSPSRGAMSYNELD